MNYDLREDFLLPTMEGASLSITVIQRAVITSPLYFYS